MAKRKDFLRISTGWRIFTARLFTERGRGFETRIAMLQIRVVVRARLELGTSGPSSPTRQKLLITLEYTRRHDPNPPLAGNHFPQSVDSRPTIGRQTSIEPEISIFSWESICAMSWVALYASANYVLLCFCITTWQITSRSTSEYVSLVFSFR